MMPGRRYVGRPAPGARGQGSTCKIQPENQTLASITFQNYFRLYDEARRHDRHGRDRGRRVPRHLQARTSSTIPTNVPVQRDRRGRRGLPHRRGEVQGDRRRRSTTAASAASRCWSAPTSIEKSEVAVRTRCQRREELRAPACCNARVSHEQRSRTIVAAGRPCPARSPSPPTWPAAAPTSSSAATSRCASTQASSRELGRDDDRGRSRPAIARRSKADDRRQEGRRRSPPAACTCIGTERHESRRIDNQLRGRSGPPGRPGPLEILLCRSRTTCCASSAARAHGRHACSSSACRKARPSPTLDQQGARERAAEAVEARNFDIRKNLLKFDDVTNDQRKAVFEQRIEFMRSPSVSDTVADMRLQLINDIVACVTCRRKPIRISGTSPTLKKKSRDVLGLAVPIREWAGEEGVATMEVASQTERIRDQLLR